MKLTREECKGIIQVVANWGTYKQYLAIKELVNEHFDNNMARTCQNLVNEMDKLDREIELLKRENKALADDNEMKCDLIEELKRKVTGLETTNKRQQEQLDRHYRAITG